MFRCNKCSFIRGIARNISTGFKVISNHFLIAIECKQLSAQVDVIQLFPFILKHSKSDTMFPHLHSQPSASNECWMCNYYSHDHMFISVHCNPFWTFLLLHQSPSCCFSISNNALVRDIHEFTVSCLHKCKVNQSLLLMVLFVENAFLIPIPRKPKTKDLHWPELLKIGGTDLFIVVLY